MKFASTIILILAALVLTAGIILQLNGFPGSFLAIGLGSMGLIVGTLLKVIGRRMPEDRN
ncbi:MAG: hypothetical protein MRZ79_02590 [Bacteroidia bacterium]|nr:hypothetical protein [Bacteroidia bacterium]